MERFALYLPAAFLADSEAPADLRVGLLAPMAQAVATLKHLSMAIRQEPEHCRYRPLVLVRDRTLRGIVGCLVGDHLAE